MLCPDTLQSSCVCPTCLLGVLLYMVQNKPDGTFLKQTAAFSLMGFYHKGLNSSFTETKTIKTLCFEVHEGVVNV